MNQEKIDSEKDEDDFQIIFDYLPKISWYQAGIVFMTGYSNVAGGSLQLAQASFLICDCNNLPDQSELMNRSANE